jgi:hypothetical protein
MRKEHLVDVADGVLHAVVLGLHDVGDQGELATVVLDGRGDGHRERRVRSCEG